MKVLWATDSEGQAPSRVAARDQRFDLLRFSGVDVYPVLARVPSPGSVDEFADGPCGRGGPT
jgi:hypothetical protein